MQSLHRAAPLCHWTLQQLRVATCLYLYLTLVVELCNGSIAATTSILSISQNTPCCDTSLVQHRAAPLCQHNGGPNQLCMSRCSLCHLIWPPDASWRMCAPLPSMYAGASGAGPAVGATGWLGASTHVVNECVKNECSHIIIMRSHAVPNKHARVKPIKPLNQVACQLRPAISCKWQIQNATHQHGTRAMGRDTVT